MGDPHDRHAAPLAVLLHGQPGVGALWGRVAELLVDDAEVRAPDRPGHGTNPLGPCGFADNAAWLTATLDGQGGDLVVVAHSWAAGVALRLATRGDARLRGLVLVNPVGPGAVNVLDRVLAAPLVGEALTMSAFVATRPALRWYLRRTADRPTDSGLRAALAASEGRPVWRSFMAEQRALVDELPGILDDVDGLAVPTVVIAGGRDRVTPERTAVDLAALLPDAELVRVPDAGHQLPFTHPWVVARAVRRLVGLPADEAC